MTDLSVYLEADAAPVPPSSSTPGVSTAWEPAGGWSILPPVKPAPADPSDAWVILAEALNAPGDLFYVDGRKVI